MSQVRFDSSKSARSGGAKDELAPQQDLAPADLPANHQSARMNDKTNTSVDQDPDMEQPQGQGNAQVHTIGKALAPPDAANDLSANATPTDPVTALADRVEQLERHNRWMRAITSVIGLSALLVLGGWFYSDGVIVNKTIMESEEVKLLDSSGNPRLFLRMYSRVPVLQLVDGNGMPRMSLGLRFDDTPFIDLSDKAGRTRATLEMTEEDAPALRLFNEDGGTKFQIN